MNPVIEAIITLCENGLKEIESGIDLKTEEGRIVFGNLLINFGMISATIDSLLNNKQLSQETAFNINKKYSEFATTLTEQITKFQTEGI